MKRSNSTTKPQKRIYNAPVNSSASPLAHPPNSFTSVAEHPTKKTPAHEPPQWVTFPPLPEAAIHSFSSAVQFVSTTLKPLTEPSIAYPSGPLANARCNGSMPPSRLNYLPPSDSLTQLPSNNPAPGVKRSRTVTSSTVPPPMGRKRSKSDFNSSSYCASPSRQMGRESPRFVPSAARARGYGSSASLAQQDAPALARHQPSGGGAQTPASLIRQKQRTSGAGAGPLNRPPSRKSAAHQGQFTMEAKYASSMRSAASMTSISSLRPLRSRAQSQLPLPAPDLPQGHLPAAPVRPTYHGGVGVYLNHDQVNEENDDSETTPRAIRTNQKSKPDLTINISLCNGASSETKSAKGVGGWCNRLVLSPLSSASSSVYSFFTSTGSTPASPGLAQDFVEDDSNSDADKKKKDNLKIPSSATQHISNKKLPFRTRQSE